ncbi:hypothetical protein ACRALDRAFT_1081421 [Sodiomyces alcalophilus JCM 7366]|uniref:uncharacterized protein n=1 Tax=Sodiomyces alcalophilus JCM 7366 TaxID=591952 RepID=UPI0039B6CC5E
MTYLLSSDSDNSVTLANPSRSCRSIDMMGYLLLNRSINRWAEACSASVDGPLLAPGTNHMFFKPDLLHQYVLQQPLYTGSLNQHTTVRRCAMWCSQVLRNKLESRSFFLLDLRPFGEPVEEKEHAELVCLFWHALHTLYPPQRGPPAWASSSEHDLGISAVELLSVVCRLILRRPGRRMHAGKGKEKASRLDFETGIASGETDTLEVALEGAQALVMRGDEELWNVFLAEFLSMDDNGSAVHPSPTSIPSPFDMDVPRDLQRVIVEAVGIEVPYQYLASRGSLLPASTESSPREPEGEPYPDGQSLGFLQQGGHDAEPYCGRDTDHRALSVFGTGDSLRQQYRDFDYGYPLDIMSADGSPAIGPLASQTFVNENALLGPSPGPSFDDPNPSPLTQPFILPFDQETWPEFWASHDYGSWSFGKWHPDGRPACVDDA